jgi:antibiotic biosynthesis monooxygenase (ABM) superfamily enzyme
MRMLTLGLIAGLAFMPATGFADSSKSKKEMVVTFSIKDYAAWRPVFDSAAADRAQKGVSAGVVYRNADSPNDLLVVFDIANKKNARAWMTSPDVRAAWEKGGVVGTPGYQFTD